MYKIKIIGLKSMIAYNKRLARELKEMGQEDGYNEYMVSINNAEKIYNASRQYRQDSVLYSVENLEQYFEVVNAVDSISFGQYYLHKGGKEIEIGNY